MGNKNKKQEDPIEKLKKWQDNQYNPGYYTGGKIPPYVSIPSETSLFGKIYKTGARLVGMSHIIIGVAVFLMIVAGSAVSLRNDHGVLNIMAALVAIVIVGGFGILCMLVGLKYIKNVKSKVKRKN